MDREQYLHILSLCSSIQEAMAYIWGQTNDAPIRFDCIQNDLREIDNDLWAYIEELDENA